MRRCTSCHRRLGVEGSAGDLHGVELKSRLLAGGMGVACVFADAKIDVSVFTVAGSKSG